MATETILKINEKGLDNSLNGFFELLLAKKLVQAIMVPVEFKEKITVALINKTELLANARPFVPVMPVSIARMVSIITRVAPSKEKIAVVMRSCELRALVELVKLKQASLENVLLIGVDCFGTFSRADYESLCKTEAPSLVDLKEGSHPQIREACKICEYPAPLTADIIVGLFGIPLDKEILILANSPTGEANLNEIGNPPADSSAAKEREKALLSLVDSRKKTKDEFFAKYREEVNGLEKLQAMFASCVNCHNCRVACPICYCRECFFDSPTFEWKADSYLNWAQKNGALAIPNDRLLFHITRMIHMSASCVGCGLCQDACPNDIKIFKLFKSTGDKVQASFDYVPGRSLEDNLPISEFRENELDDLGK